MKTTPLVIVSTCVLLLLLLPLTSSAQTVPNWAPNTSYAVGALVMFNGVEFKCIQAHTSQVGWEPPNVPALWQPVSGNPGPTPTPTPTPTPPPPTPTPTPTPGGGGGGSCAPAWSAATVYSAPGTLVSRNGVNYKNNWWTQGEDPATHNGPAGSGQPWTAVGVCSACSTISAAPTGLTASAVSNGSTTLRWNAVTPPANCSISNYTVFQNSSAIGTTSGTSFTATGLCSASTFSFQVAANDGAGQSGKSNTANVTGTSCSGGTAGAFAIYKDITINADFNTGAQRSNVTGSVQPVTSAMLNSTLVWGFATGDCRSESWAGITPAQEATNVQTFVNAGKKYILGTGGQAGSFSCSAGSDLIAFINRYNSANLVGVDFDIESGQSQATIDALITSTMAAQQQFPNLTFSFTVPSLGTTAANPITAGNVGDVVVREIKRLGLGGKFIINLMAMDYGSTNPNNCVVSNGHCDMGQSAVQAAQALNQQSGIAMSHIGVTVMIGQNDTSDEVFQVADADTLSNFAKSSGLGAVRFWAFDRDTPNGNGGLSTMNGNGAPALAYSKEFLKFFQ